MDRRRAIALLGAGLLATACGPEGEPTVKDPKTETHAYGEDRSQYGELFRPPGNPRGVVVVIHGGFWKAQYDLSLGRPLAEDLAANGWIAWNLEYRRVGNGGGWPGTFDDIAAGIDHLDDIPDIPTDSVVTLGHSAGGHLAVWAAGRAGMTDNPWANPVVSVKAAIPQAGVLDLDAASKEQLGSDAVKRLMGDAPGDQYELTDPMKRIPLSVPVYCLHAADDDTVPISQSLNYVKTATAAGAQAELIEVVGGHFGHIDPMSPAWAKTLEVLDRL